MPVLVRRWSQSALLLSTSVFLAACSGDHPQTTFEPVSEFGRTLNRLFANTFWWTIGILVLVELMLVIAMVKYKERAGTPKPKQIHGNVKLEFLWTVIPAVIVLFIAIPTIQVTIDTQKRPPADALIVEVIGHQWWWEYKYPEYGVTTANELVLPVGRTVDLKMHSADVVHSFWIPRVGGKRDVNPQPRVGRGERAPASNHLTFNIEEPGYYSGQCAEFCGLAHAIMRAAVIAMPANEFEQWVASMGGRAGAAQARPEAPPQQPRDTLSAADTLQRAVAAPAPTPVAQTPLQGAATPAGPLSEADRGKQLLTSKVCIACHTIQNTSARGVMGPNLTRFGARRTLGAGARPNTLENVIAWITNPQSLKPGALMPGAQSDGGGMKATGMTPEEVRAIATYLMSLK
jgi:cytochrome c oxidase subunit 2